MKFAVTHHSGSGAPADALDLLWQHLENLRHEEVSFNRRGPEILAHTGQDAPISMERDEREEIGRLAVLECVREVCDQHPELRSSWYAISPRG